MSQIQLHKSHIWPAPIEHAQRFSASSASADLSLTSLECLLVLWAYKNPGVSVTLMTQPGMHSFDAEKIKKCLHNLINKGLLQDNHCAGSEPRVFELTSRGEEAIGHIRTTWKALMGQPSVSVTDIRAAINVLTLLETQGADEAAC
ncbi:hypothetical protein MA998_004063 [Escherichia coli]|nr:hypothetical protein [Escherichia coli]